MSITIILLLLFIMEQINEKWQLLISKISKGIVQNRVYHVCIYTPITYTRNLCNRVIYLLKKSSLFHNSEKKLYSNIKINLVVSQ